MGTAQHKDGRTQFQHQRCRAAEQARNAATGHAVGTRRQTATQKSDHETQMNSFLQYRQTQVSRSLFSYEKKFR
jgi:hypothetical protein